MADLQSFLIDRTLAALQEGDRVRFTIDGYGELEGVVQPFPLPRSHGSRSIYVEAVDDDRPGGWGRARRWQLRTHDGRPRQGLTALQRLSAPSAPTSDLQTYVPAGMVEVSRADWEAAPGGAAHAWLAYPPDPTSSAVTVRYFLEPELPPTLAVSSGGTGAGAPRTVGTGGFVPPVDVPGRPWRVSDGFALPPPVPDYEPDVPDDEEGWSRLNRASEPATELPPLNLPPVFTLRHDDPINRLPPGTYRAKLTAVHWDGERVTGIDVDLKEPHS